MGDLHPPERTHRVVYVVTAMAAGLFVVRLLGAPWPRFPLTFPDSHSFLKVARRGPLHGGFWFDERPVGYPLFLWAVGRSATLATLGQTLAYTGAFVALCFAAVRLLAARLAAAVVVLGALAIAVQPRFALWNTEILSESLSLTVAIAGIVAWWRAASRPTVRRLRWAIGWSVLWMLIRDANVVSVLPVVGPVMFLFAMSQRVSRPVRQCLVSGVVVLILVGAFVASGDVASQRNQYPMHNNIGLRVLTDRDLTAWFVAGGMPLDQALIERTGHASWDDGEVFLRAPALEPYREWAREQGRTRLALSMVLRAPDWIDRLHRELPNIVRSDGVEAYDTFKTSDRLPRRVPFSFGAATSRGQLLLWTTIAFAAAAFAALDRRRRLVAVFGVVGLVSALVDLYVCYVGDAVEVNRHLVGPLARVAVMSIICVGLGIDRLVAFASERSRPRVAR